MEESNGFLVVTVILMKDKEVDILLINKVDMIGMEMLTLMEEELEEEQEEDHTVEICLLVESIAVISLMVDMEDMLKVDITKNTNTEKEKISPICSIDLNLIIKNFNFFVIHFLY